ncbi:MAG: hypothetical protein AB7F65_03555 [Dehalococcoidia bacterium]
MADDQHTPEDASISEDETRDRRGGLGRFASRFRRDRRANVEERVPGDPDYPSIVPASRGRIDDLDEPPALAPELDLTRTPPLRVTQQPPLQTAPQVPQAPQASVEPAPEASAPSAVLGASEAEGEASPESEDDPATGETAPTIPEPPSAADETTPEALPTFDEAAAEVPAAVPAAIPAAGSPLAAQPSVAPEIATPATPAPAPILRLAGEPAAPAPPLPEVGEEPEPRGPRFRPAGISPHLVVVSGLATVVMLAFLLIEPSPRWLLLLGAAAVVFGLDGTLRQTWREPFALGQETAPFLFVPALYMMAVPVLIEHNVSGELVILVGLGAGLGFGALAWAEVASVRPMAPEYDQARLVVTANTYLTGFAIFSLTYVFELGLPAAIVATGIAAAMLAVEVLREGEIDPMETLGLSLVAGVVLGELRWLLYYVPLDTYLAGLTLLLAFYLATGLLHSHVIRALNRIVAAEYSGIAAAGLALVILARAAGLA